MFWQLSVSIGVYQWFNLLWFYLQRKLEQIVSLSDRGLHSGGSQPTVIEFSEQCASVLNLHDCTPHLIS